ncbi:hypothetical protein C6P08_04905 [Weissella confusa]|uniref:hypothetical protein n=1 Tax=Weissella confusa TaxID=1583 RepID=UPI00109238FD|nr:hypothetical protein [Weissella confusa]MBJ7694775.1 hypothetical protein [Weissella confusa]QBZ04557.1 hypothetical protein C6P08_04905 [Weissella confusa]
MGVKKLTRDNESIITLILLFAWVKTQQNWAAFLMVLGVAIKYISLVAAVIAIVVGVLIVIRFIALVLGS